MPARPKHQPPTLIRAARGYYYTRWGGQTFTFGSVEEEARAKFLSPASQHPGSLARWAAWREMEQHAASTLQAGARSRRTVIELAEEFFDQYSSAGREETATYFRSHLRRFLHACGAFKASDVDVGMLEAFRVDLSRLGRGAASVPGADVLAPKTIAHDLKAIKTFWRWASSIHPAECRAIELTAIKVPRQQEPTPHPITPEAVRSMISLGAAAHPELRSWLSLMYLAALRPSEVLRIAAGEGRFEPIVYPAATPDGPTAGGVDRSQAGAPCRVVERGLYVIRSKVQHRTGAPRRVVLSDEALMWLDECQRHSVIQSGPDRGQLGPRWRTLDSLSRCVRGACGRPPSVLRDSAATHLLARGVAWGDVDLLLGHVPSGAGRSYMQIAWHVLRDSAARLRL